MMISPAQTPVTVIGGFLGAGKTTFLNHLLRESSSRCAVLVNDFGAVNIDDSLIVRHDGTTMTLTNGCLCCSMGDGFLDTLGRLLDAQVPFDHIIIEASGVGDPWRIAEIALVEPALRLNAVVVLADASRIETLLSDRRVGDTVRRQFERCDVVLLTKVDLVDAAAIRSARDAVMSLRNDVRIIETAAQAMPSLQDIHGRFISGFRADMPLASGADHEQAFRRWSYRRRGCFDPASLATAMRDLPPQLIRLKGFVRVAGEDAALVLQRVGQDWTLTPTLEVDPDGDDDIVLVGIGTPDLPDAAGLDDCLDRALRPSMGGHQTTSFHPLKEGQSSCR